MKTLKKSLSIVLSFLMVFTTVVFFNPIKAEAYTNPVTAYTGISSARPAFEGTSVDTKFLGKYYNNLLYSPNVDGMTTGDSGSSGYAVDKDALYSHKYERSSFSLWYAKNTVLLYDGVNPAVMPVMNALHRSNNYDVGAKQVYPIKDTSTNEDNPYFSLTNVWLGWEKNPGPAYNNIMTKTMNGESYDWHIGHNSATVYDEKDSGSKKIMHSATAMKVNDAITGNSDFAENGYLELYIPWRVRYQQNGQSEQDLRITASSPTYVIDFSKVVAIRNQILSEFSDLANNTAFDAASREAYYNAVLAISKLDPTAYTYSSNTASVVQQCAAAIKSAVDAYNTARDNICITVDASALKTKLAEVNEYAKAETGTYTNTTFGALVASIEPATGVLNSPKTLYFKNYNTTAELIAAANTERTKISNQVTALENVISALATTVSFNTAENGGTGVISSLTFTVGRNTTVTIDDLSKYTSSKTNNDFLGWNTDPNATTGQLTGSITVPLGATLYAIFTPSLYKLVLDGNGATTGSYEPTWQEFGKDLEFPKTRIFTRIGYSELGWSQDKDATKASVGSGNTIVGGVTGLNSGDTVTYYIVWKPNTYNVVFNGSGATGTMATKTYTYDQTSNLPVNTFTKEGGIFLGWATEEGSKEVVYKDGAEIKNLTAENRATINLYAVWDIAQYTVEFKKNDGTTSDDFSMTVDVSQEFTLPAEEAFSIPGCTLIGWATKSNSKEVEYEPGASVKRLAGNGETITLYAMWEAAVYRVIFEYANGSKTVTQYGWQEEIVVPTTNSEDNYDDTYHYTYSWPEVDKIATKDVTYKEVANATAHDLELVERREPTCTQDGYVVENCACGYEKRTVLEATGHTYDSVVTDPTCTEQGYTTYTCTKEDCDKGNNWTYVDNYVDALGHTESAPVREKEKAEDCGNDGYYEEVVYCSRCNEELSRTPVVVSATGDHKYGAGVVTAPTCTEPGGTKYVCTVCGDTKYEDEVPAIGHKWAETTYAFAEDGSTCTATRVCENDDTHIETATAVITSEQKAAPTCTVNGWTTYTATFDVEWATVQTLDVQDIEAIGHDWAATKYKFKRDGSTCAAARVCNNDYNHIQEVNATITSAVKTPATCTEKGWTTYTATFNVDWATVQTLDVKDIRALGHTKAEAVQENEKAATCTEKGSYESVVYCSVCNEEISRKVVKTDRLGHNWSETTYNFAEDGSACTATRECLRDGCDYAETANATITSEVVKAPTCLATGDTKYTAHFFASWTENQTLTVVGDIAKTGHKEDRYTMENVVDATCATPGSYTKVIKCMVCGEELSRETGVVIPATGMHKEGPVVRTEITESHTCDQQGAYKLETFCTVCNIQMSCREYAYLSTSHVKADPVKENEIPATCTSEGSYDSVVYCSVCDKVLSVDKVTVPMIDHTEETIPGTPATCTESGLTDGTKCSVCEEVLKEQEVIPAGHTPIEEMDNVVSATCTEDGSYDLVVRCEVCQTKLSRETVTTPAIDHDYVASVTEPTCTEQGYTTYTCSRGDASYKDDLVPALDHNFVEYKSNNDATCTEDGTMTSKCTRCDATDTVTEEDSKLGHTFTNYVSNNNAACETNCTETAKCDRCDETDTREIEGTALGHSFTTYVSDNNAGCFEDGTKTAKCDRCEATDTVTDEGTAIGHHTFENYEKDGNATCIADGTKTSKCTYCDATFTVPDVGSALGSHSFTNYVSNNNATCTKNGTETAKCNYCNVTHTRAVAGSALGHSYTVEVGTTAANCQSPATTTYKCERCDVTNVVYGEALGDHSYVDVTVVTLEPTCTAGGKYVVVTKCEICGDVTNTSEEKNSEPADHHYVLVSSKEGTCVSVYTMTYECTECGKEDVRNGDKLGEHSRKAPKQENVVLPTCATAGSYDMVTRCRYCNKEISRTHYTVSNLEHSFTVLNKRTAATCAAPSSETYRCAYCDETVTKSGSTLGNHKKTTKVDESTVVEATCAKGGSYQEVTYCTVCNTEFGRVTKTTAKLDHTSTELQVITIPATTTSTGSRQEIVTCKDCKEVISDVTIEIPVINSNSGSDNSGSDNSGSDNSGSNSGSSSSGIKLSFWDKLIAFFRSILSLFGL